MAGLEVAGRAYGQLGDRAAITGALTGMAQALQQTQQTAIAVADFAMRREAMQNQMALDERRFGLEQRSIDLREQAAAGDNRRADAYLDLATRRTNLAEQEHQQERDRLDAQTAYWRNRYDALYAPLREALGDKVVQSEDASQPDFVPALPSPEDLANMDPEQARFAVAEAIGAQQTAARAGELRRMRSTLQARIAQAQEGDGAWMREEDAQRVAALLEQGDTEGAYQAFGDLRDGYMAAQRVRNAIRSTTDRIDKLGEASPLSAGQRGQIEAIKARLATSSYDPADPDYYEPRQAWDDTLDALKEGKAKPVTIRLSGQTTEVPPTVIAPQPGMSLAWTQSDPLVQFWMDVARSHAPEVGGDRVMPPDQLSTFARRLAMIYGGWEPGQDLDAWLRDRQDFYIQLRRQGKNPDEARAALLEQYPLQLIQPKEPARAPYD